MDFFATDFSQLSVLLEVIYALMWALFYITLGSIPIHYVCCVVKKEKSLYSQQTSKVDYFPEDIPKSFTPEPFHIPFIPASIRQVPQKSGLINQMSYNELRTFAKVRGVKLKNPKKVDLIAALS